MGSRFMWDRGDRPKKLTQEEEKGVLMLAAKQWAADNLPYGKELDMVELKPSTNGRWRVSFKLQDTNTLFGTIWAENWVGANGLPQNRVTVVLDKA